MLVSIKEHSAMSTLASGTTWSGGLCQSIEYIKIVKKIERPDLKKIAKKVLPLID